MSVINFTKIKREKNELITCDCKSKTRYVIDEENHTVQCANCGARVEPFKALLNLAMYEEDLRKKEEVLRRETERYKRYVPKRRTIQMLERDYNKRKYKAYPHCPACDEPFKLEEIAGNWKLLPNTERKLRARLGSEKK